MTDDEAREVERMALLDLLDRHRDAGRVIPCQTGTPAERARWTSDRRRDRTAAAQACGTCPALDACNTYGRRWPRELGVYAGVLNTHAPTKDAP